MELDELGSKGQQQLPTGCGQLDYYSKSVSPLCISSSVHPLLYGAGPAWPPGLLCHI